MSQSIIECNRIAYNCGREMAHSKLSHTEFEADIIQKQNDMKLRLMKNGLTSDEIEGLISSNLNKFELLKGYDYEKKIMENNNVRNTNHS